MDEFSDDGFDDLNDTVLQDLEKNAVQFTQALKPAQSQDAPNPPSLLYEYDFGEDDLDDAVVIDGPAPQNPARPAIGTSLPRQQPRPVPNISRQRGWNHASASNDSVAARSRYRTPSHAPAAQPQSQRDPPRDLPYPRPQRRPPAAEPQFVRTSNVSHRFRVQPSQASQPHGAGNHEEIISALQARVSELERELTSAKGEVSIVRSKAEKAQANNDAEITRLKNQNAEALETQKRMLEAASAAERAAVTELQFTRRDLEDERGKARSRRKDGPTTPKRNKTWGIADGFDDVETLPSPTKGQGQRRRDAGPMAGPLAERTPTKGKRKRAAIDSPVTALETHSEDVVMAEDAPILTSDCVAGPNELPFDVGRGRNFKFGTKMLTMEAVPQNHFGLQSSAWKTTDIRFLFTILVSI
jgi:hypothetical protein